MTWQPCCTHPRPRTQLLMRMLQSLVTQMLFALDSKCSVSIRIQPLFWQTLEANLPLSSSVHHEQYFSRAQSFSINLEESNPIVTIIFHLPALLLFFNQQKVHSLRSSTNNTER